MMASVLFAIWYPQIHAVKHFNETHAKEICEHKHNNQHEITHEHEFLQDCFICSFHFTPFDNPIISYFSVTNALYFQSVKLYCNVYFTNFFNESVSLLRGPPLF